MAITESSLDSNSQTDNEGQDSNDTGQGGQGEPRSLGNEPEPYGGPILAALQRQVRGPQVSAPGPGNMADSLGKLKIAIDLMQMSLSGFETESKQHGDILTALDTLRAHLPEQGNASGLEETHLKDLLKRQKQNPVMQAISGLMNNKKGASPPMPSTPLPGA